MITKLLIRLWPLWLTLFVSTLAGVGSYMKGRDAGYTAAIKDEIVKIRIPDCNCPPPLPSNGVDFGKLKGKGITIQNHQHFEMNANISDSVFRAAIREELSRVGVVRCKR